MKKVQLKNKSSINKGSVSGPMGDEMTLNERGLLDDNSGSVEESFHGYGYYYARAANGAITVRYLITWIRTETSFGGNITLDDGNNPDQSGYMGEPITNSDPEHYELILQQINNVGTIGSGTLTGSWTISYYYYPKGKSVDDQEFKTKYNSDSITFQVPSYEDLINPHHP